MKNILCLLYMALFACDSNDFALYPAAVEHSCKTSSRPCDYPENAYTSKCRRYSKIKALYEVERRVDEHHLMHRYGVAHIPTPSDYELTLRYADIY